MALNSSPEFGLKLTYWYLLKAGHVPGDTWGGANFAQSDKSLVGALWVAKGPTFLQAEN